MLLMALLSWQMICPKSWFLTLKHTTLEEKEVSKVQSWTHISHRALERLSVDIWLHTKNELWYRGFHNAIQSSVTNMPPSIWKLILLLTKEEVLAKKKKCNAERWDKSTRKKLYKILWTEDLEDKCLGTIHKIKSVICAALSWIHTHFKCIQMFCILQ